MTRYKGIDHLALATGDLDATIRFWRDLLGMRMVAGLGGPGFRHYFFEVSEHDLIAFFEWPGVEPLAERDHGAPRSGPAGFDHVSIGVHEREELWAIKDRLEAAGIWVSEVVDHASVYQARFVEIANVSANAVTLDDYTIQRYSNGGTNAVNVALSGTLSAGDVWVIANSQAEFEVEYGAGVADQFNATISGTGDDTYVLAHLGNVADIYGEIGVDGDTELWFYEDSVATRNAGVTTPNTVWTASEWTITPGSAAATPGVR